MGAKLSKSRSSASSTRSQRSVRSGSLHQSAGSLSDDNNAGCLMISPYQKALLIEAWKRMSKKGASSIGSQIFRRMFDKSPEIKRVFQHVVVIEGVFSFGLTPIQAYHQHSGMFVEILDEAINAIDDLASLIPKCNEYGAKHATYKSYGFKAEFWDTFGEAMISAAREWEGWKKHRETLRAWTILISFIVDRMRNGYETAVKKQYLNMQNSAQQDETKQDETNSQDGESCRLKSSSSAATASDDQKLQTPDSGTKPRVGSVTHISDVRLSDEKL